jgi:ribosomal protein S18 acetylase RimI-like enzyme
MTPSELVIRRATRADVDLVLSAENLFAFPPTAEWTQDFLDRGSNLLLLALLDDEPVGMLVAVETSYLGASPDLFVYGIRVHEHVRNRGIAHQLVDKAVEVGGEAGCRRVWGSLQLPDDLGQQPPLSPPEGDAPGQSTFIIPIP